MNKVILMGRLVGDPEIRYSQEGKCVARYRIAVNRRFKREGEADADFFNCVVFGKGAQFTEKYLRKGMKIALVGRIQTGSYTNREGQKVNTTDIVVEEQTFAESKGAVQQEEPRREPPKSEGFMDIPEGIGSELPFV